jgi:hypothetical protein
MRHHGHAMLVSQARPQFVSCGQAAETGAEDQTAGHARHLG